MALDGVLLSCVVNELNNNLITGRVDKVYQPEKDEIHILIRSKGENHRLLLSASSNNPRLHLTEVQKQNPLSPPMFCMLMRKHLIGGRIVSICQPDFERIIEFYIESKDELGDLTIKKLIIEIMGRHSNIILVDRDGIILDSIKHVTHEISRVRQVLPGKSYMSPPSQGKQNPLFQDSIELGLIFSAINSPQQAAKKIADSFTGVSRVTAQEILHRSMMDQLGHQQKTSSFSKDNLTSAFKAFFNKAETAQLQPVVLKDDTGHPLDVLPTLFYQYDPELQEHFESASKALEYFYVERDKSDRNRQYSSNLLKVLQTNLERCEKKSAVLLKEYQEAQNAEQYRLWGELITSNLYQIYPGVDRAELVNYYHPDSISIEVPLDPHKTANQNAQIYFKKYNKGKKALRMIDKQLEDNKEEILYLETQLDNLNKCTEESEIEEIREELAKEGYIRIHNKKQSSRKRPPSKPHHFISSDNLDIWVGKNNAQNDRLTLRTAEPEDLWLHTKEIPGSHVIIRTMGKKVPPQTLLEAGMLAAFFSKAKHSSNVPVDYCPRKNVKKPNGAKLGMVIYDHYNTMFVTPCDEVLGKMRKIQ